MSKNSEKVKAWRRKTKQNLIAGFGGACQICGYNKCHRALAFHHKNPAEKEFGLGKLRASIKGWNILVEEIQKCALVCHNCHAEIHDGIIALPHNIQEFNPNIVEEFQKKLKAKLNLNKKCYCGESLSKNSKASKCKKCAAFARRKIIWPKPDEIKELIWKIGCARAAKQLGVSDKAVEKYCKKHNIEKPKRGHRY